MTLKFTCISASNVENARQHSASTHACEIVRDLLLEDAPADTEVEIVRLLDYEPKPCRMCGSCFVSGQCAYDPDFNEIFLKLRESDAIFIVVPHYSPLPSKLIMILEKLNEMAFLNYCANDEYRSPFYCRPVAIIAHGGQTEEALPYYKKALLEPVANALSGVQMKVIGMDEDNPNGVVFGIRSISAQTDSIFVKTEHDWDAIRQRMAPLVKKVIQEVAVLN